MSPYEIDQVVSARVEQTFPFGIFVFLPDGTRGYVRKRELTQAGNLDPRQVVSEGDEFQAVVVALPEPGQNLELSVRRAEPDPWDAFVRSHEVRDTVTATVKNLAAHGVFAQVLPGVDGFIPCSELSPWPVEQPQDLLWIGDQVEAVITHLDRHARRLRLSVRQQMEHQARVRSVLDFLYQQDEIEESREVEEQPEPAGDRDLSGVDGALIERLGRMLVVDDHAEVREPLVKWLRRLGFAAEGIGSSSEALILLEEKEYGLVLVDLDLSGKDGLGLIDALENAASDTLVAVMSTPEWIAQRSEELAALGVVDVYVKPLNLDEILESLARIGREDGVTPLWSPPDQRDEERSQSSFEQLTETMRSGLSLAARFEAGLRELVGTAKAEEGLVFHLDPDSGRVSIVAQVGDLSLNEGAIYALGESPVKDVICEKAVAFETHVSAQSRRRFSKLLALLDFESCLGVPIQSGGEVHHALFLFHRKPKIFSRYRLRDARATAMLFGVALESQALEQRIRSVSPIFLSGQLAAGFGHEVYNKMSGLELQIRNLQADCDRLERGWIDERWAEGFDPFELSWEMNQLLAVAMDLKGTVELFRELIQDERAGSVDVNEVLRRTVYLVRPTSCRHQVQVETDLAPDLPPVIGSAVRLEQVFANLILNAVQQTAQKMTRWSDGQGVLCITAAREERSIRVRFADNGPGIHRSLWENIFALGFSTRPGGTGLGLFIARSLVESMGGRILVEQSAIPTGTTFLVELPEA